MQAVQTPPRPLSARDENKQAAKQPAKRKEKASALCKTPPSLIRDTQKGVSFRRGLCIGEGGFARCFQVNSGDGNLYAAKTIAKASLSSTKTRQKLLAEIKIHRDMRHPSIVKFVDCFEDNANVYILLEMCSNATLMDMVRRRRFLSEIEARYFMVQILGAVNYMQNKMVIHRDLKLGNIFIDANMNIKIGDFGLAAALDSPDQRRKSICGTPNYISPEVLLRPHEHSFPVDIWATGIILYAMMFGKPPFQERDVNVIYERIKIHDLNMPADARVSPECLHLIQWMLAPDPNMRPTVSEVLAHKWFEAEFVHTLPVSALRSAPLLRASYPESMAAFAAAKVEAGLGARPDTRPVSHVTQADLNEHPANGVLPVSISPPSTKDKYRAVVVQTADESQQVPDYDSPVVERRRRHQHPLSNVASGSGSSSSQSSANTAPSAPATRMPVVARRMSTERGNQPPRRPLSNYVSSLAGAAASMAMGGAQAAAQTNHADQPAQNYGGSGLARKPSTQTSRSLRAPHSAGAGAPGMVREVAGVVEQVVRNVRANLSEALRIWNNGRGELVTVSQASTSQPKPPHVTKWADFDEQWGLSYGLSDGSTGMHFLDGTMMRYDTDFGTYMAYEPSQDVPSAFVASRTTSSTLNPQRARKIDIVNFVHRYMEDRLGRGAVASDRKEDVSDGSFLYKYRRGPFYMMFVLSDGTVQFNFNDHTKVVVYAHGTMFFVVDPHHRSFVWSLPEMMNNKRNDLDLLYKLDSILAALS